MPPKAPDAQAAPAKVVTSTAPVVTKPELRKKELIDAVVTRSGIKKKDAKPVVEAMLEVLGDTLKDNRDMALKPFGKLKVQRVKDLAGARVLIAKIRQPKH